MISVLANELAGMGHEVLVIVFAKADKEYFLNANVKKETLYDFYRVYKKASAFRRLRRIRKLLREFQPNAAVGFMEAGYALFLSSIGMRFSKIGSLRMAACFLEQKKSLRGKLEQMWFRKASAVVIQDNGQKEYAILHGWSAPTVIANPLNSSVLASGEYLYRSVCSRLIMVGRLCADKNYPLAFEALKQAEKVVSELTLEIYGEGELEGELASLAVQLGIQNKIGFKGWLDDIVSAYRENDLFLITSDSEGLPNALLEAMGCGLPCITTDCFVGAADLIENGVTGLLVPVNDVNALSDAIVKVCTMPLEERMDMGRKARRFVTENYNAERIAGQWLALMESL